MMGKVSIPAKRTAKSAHHARSEAWSRGIIVSLLMTTTQTELRLAKRMSRLGTETAFEVLVRARALERQGKNIIHLEIGEPDMDTPANVVEAGVDALRKGFTHYGPAAGLPELREAIAAEVSSSRGIKVSPDEVVIVPGGKPIIFFTMLALVEEGDEVIYPNPGFPIYESMINFARRRCRFRCARNAISGSMSTNWPA
jgi:aspartate/methionine/tyrosine aminotransferase